MNSSQTKQYMYRALELAKKGTGAVNPNPLVGAVLVKDNRIIGEGYHQKYGQLHAERNAIADCYRRGENPAGAELYATLEPCCHYGKTPPCTEAIIENKIVKVYVGSNDPNPLVDGGGIAVLRAHGIEVETGILKQECDALNEIFFHYIRTKRPFVLMKYAMTMDGKIATVTGDSKWITGEAARRQVHEDRNRCAAIMAGVGTVIADNPMLNCRLPEGHSPVRIICDTSLRTPADSLVVTTAKEIPTILATCCTDKEKQKVFTDKGCKILEVTETYDKNGKKQLDLQDLCKQLGEQKIDSVLLEGGAVLNGSALQAGIVSCMQTYIAPKIFGGQEAKSPVGGSGVKLACEAYGFEIKEIRRIGEDILIRSVPKKGAESRCLQESLKKSER